MKIGTTDILNTYCGEDEIIKIYEGTDEIYNGETDPEQECYQQGGCWDGVNCLDCAEYDCLQQGGCWDGENCNECE